MQRLAIIEKDYGEEKGIIVGYRLTVLVGVTDDDMIIP